MDSRITASNRTRVELKFPLCYIEANEMEDF